jgi:hypothetical protein
VAQEFRNGEVVDGVGGGVCQVSTTTYNAALLSNLKIVRRSPHSMPVTYVPAGRDAAVYYGAVDLQFENTTDAPIYISTRARRGRLTIRVFGVPPSTWNDVRIVSGRRWGTRVGGFGVNTWRVVTLSDGSEKRESLGSSTYRPPKPKTQVARAADAPAAPRRRRVRAARRSRRTAPATPAAPSAAPAPSSADEASSDA